MAKPIAADLADRFTVEQLKAIEWTFAGERGRDQIKKPALCDRVAALVTFADTADYQRFYSSLPKLLQKLLDRGIFRDEVDCSDVNAFGRSKIIAIENDRYTRTIGMNPAERVHCFVPENERYIRLVEPFRSIFRQFADRPPEWEFAPVSAPRGTVWTNEREMAENLPLLVAETGALIWSYDTRAARLKKKCLKNELKNLRARSGLPPFPLTAETGLDPIDLFVPLVAALHAETKKKVSDIDEWVMATLRRFFFEDKTFDQGVPVYDYLQGSKLELQALARHLGEESWGDVFNEFPRPRSRDTLRWLLGEIGPSGVWYDVDRLLSTLEARGKSLSFFSRKRERWPLFFRAGAITVNGDSFAEYDEKIGIFGPLHREVVYRPLLKAYCYVLAIFGIVEISEVPSPRPVLRKGKPSPISPYDALSCVRVTDYGRWFLGLSDHKPERAAGQYETIADKELLLVTFRGRSLERKLFLEEIGDPLGSERFRISEVSFTRGCKQAGDVKARILRFAELIEKEPSPRWQAFFKSILDRVGMFSRPDRALMFDLSGMSPSVGAAIFSDSRLSEIAIRAEGNRIVIPEARYRQFVKLLGEHGFVTPETM